MTYTAHFRVWRGDAAGGDLRDYEVEVNEGEVVLDIIHRLQATQTPDLAVRWNCKAGKCGSCSAEINGRPRLLCMTRMSTFTEAETIVVTPIRAFPVMRDLVTDVSFNYAKARAVPAFRPPAGLEPGDYRMAQVDVERSQEFRKCIECFLCQNTCHVIRDHEENKPAFAGPRFFIRVAELDMHPLDSLDRRSDAQDAWGLGMCNITKCCSEVCPEGIKITDNGIIPLKERVVDSRYDPFFSIASLRRRTGARGRNVSSGASTAEQRARQQLQSRPGDRGAMSDLADALLAQGRFAEAAEHTRDLLAGAGRSRGARRSAHERHAWALLCAVEAGQRAWSRVRSEVDTSVGEARRLADTGTVVDGLCAVHAVTDGRPDEAQALLRDSHAWHRSDHERADGLLTAARALAALGQSREAAAAAEQGGALWPDNPRLPAVRRLVEEAAAGEAAASVGDTPMHGSDRASAHDEPDGGPSSSGRMR